MAYSHGTFLGKGEKTIVEIEVLPGKNSIDLMGFLMFSELGIFLIFMFLRATNRAGVSNYSMYFSLICLGIIILPMAMLPIYDLFAQRNKTLRLLQTHLMSLNSSPHAEISDDQSLLMDEEAPRQDEAQG